MSDGPHSRYPNVFRPIRIGRTAVRNRIFVPAHTTSFGENNLPSDRHLAYHRARAAGGAGLIIFEGIRVHRSSLGRQQGVNGYDRAAIPKFRDIARAVQDEGGRLFGQIIHLGRHIDGNFTRTPSWSASAIPWSATAPAPHPMTTDEIATVVAAHGDVAMNLMEAGLDGIELQMAHGHLLQQFLSPASNRRTDDYGGSPENRLRFALETLAAVRRAMGPDRTLGIRISADEYLAGGLTLDDMTDIVRRLGDAVQVDFVNVSHSAYHGSYTVSTQMADMAFTLAEFQPLTRRIAAALDGAADRPVVMTVCRYQEIAQAEEMLASGDTDLVGMARAHIADPDIVNKAHDGREADTTPCIGCNQGCAGFLAQSLAITCLTNPRAGKERSWPLPEADKADDPKRVLVVGGGPAGMEAAWVAAARGHAVTLWERSDRLGGQLNWLEKMPLRAEFAKLLTSQQRRLERHDVKIQLGTEATMDSIDGHDADAVVFATGGRPMAQRLASGPVALTLQDALADPDALGQNVVMVDALGTWSVVSVAEFLADAGKTVTLIAPTGTPGWTISMYSAFALRDRLKRKKIRVIGGHALHDHVNGVAQLTDLSTGEPGPTVRADSVIAPLHGSADDALRNRFDATTTSFRCLSAGDCQSPRTALEAVYEGHEAGRAI